MSIGYYTRRKYNFFSYLAQEKSSGAFLMWLVNYLNSEVGFAFYRQMFFSNIILYFEDKGREVKDIVPVYEQDDNVILRMAYVPTMEEHLLTRENWSLVNCGLFSNVMDKLYVLNHPLIKMFGDELTYRYRDEYDDMMDCINVFHDRDTLVKPEAARYVYDTFIENFMEMRINEAKNRQDE